MWVTIVPGALHQIPKHKNYGCFITTIFQMLDKFLWWPTLSQNNMGSTFWERCFQLVKIDQSCYSTLFGNLSSICTLLTTFEKGRLESYASCSCCCCCSVTKSCLTVWDSMDCSSPESSIFHYLPEFAQIQVHWFGGTIQSSHPLLPSSFAFNLSQHQAWSFSMNWLLSMSG